MSTRQIFFGKKFKTPLCKIGELVMAYDVTAGNRTTHPIAFYTLYIGPNNSGTSRIVFKLLMKQPVTTPKCKPKPMAKTIVEVVNEMGKQEKYQIHHKTTLSDLGHIAFKLSTKQLVTTPNANLCLCLRT